MNSFTFWCMYGSKAVIIKEDTDIKGSVGDFFFIFFTCISHSKAVTSFNILLSSTGHEQDN